MHFHSSSWPSSDISEGTCQFLSIITVATVRERHDDSTTTCKDKTNGDKRIDKTASTFWDNLPSETRNEQSLEIFKKNVKTYLFRIAYYDFM